MKFLTVLLLFPLIGLAQHQGKFSFEFGGGKNTFSMARLNQYYVNSFAIKNKMLEEGISSGDHFFIGLKYRPNTLFDFGLYGNYQFGKTSGKPEFIITDDFGQAIGTRELDFILKTEAIGFGISSCWYISHFLKFHEKESKFLNRFHMGVELNAGIGFSKAIVDLRDPELAYASSYEYFTSSDFQGQVSLKFEYDYLKSPIISSIGIKGGYQYFKTKTLKSRQGNDWIVLGEYPINLDFSGFFGTLFMSIGK
ncbi:MAG: hypothetical protein EBS09_11770 [Flavobacteriia bacterium]|nr:hypothetical protein [Flavobacteriia bacterium]NBV68994.1 hypothetical protein [Flavobacteriia bacterium]